MRRYLLDQLEEAIQQADFQLISGMTGSGKTIVIESVPRTLNLEGLANHRGSTFGRMVSPQPSQIDFENSLAIALLKMLSDGEQRVYVEDESRLIGRCFLPVSLQDRMRQAPIVLVEESLERRIEVVVADYINDLGKQFAEAFGDEEGPTLHRDKLKADLLKIRKRLGTERHGLCERTLEAAFETQWKTGDTSHHHEWITMLLEGYYDPMYRFQLAKRGGETLFVGSRPEVIDYLRRQHHRNGMGTTG